MKPIHFSLVFCVATGDPYDFIYKLLFSKYLVHQNSNVVADGGVDMYDNVSRFLKHSLAFYQSWFQEAVTI
jgi:ABC-type proline/glycine betaine transport system substrate-binding protein